MKIFNAMVTLFSDAVSLLALVALVMLAIHPDGVFEGAGE